MKIITMCGSFKFIDEIIKLAEHLELEGNCVLVPIYNSNKPNERFYTKEDKLMFDKMHKEKIKLSDAIFVVNINNYIGESTKNEIKYAKELDKEIIYYTDYIT